MKYTQVITVILLGMAFIGGIVAWGMAGEAREPPIMTYQGQIRSVKIDRCGLQPGSCEGSILLAKRDGGGGIVGHQAGYLDPARQSPGVNRRIAGGKLRHSTCGPTGALESDRATALHAPRLSRSSASMTDAPWFLKGTGGLP
jgi:hypothetical protein